MTRRLILSAATVAVVALSASAFVSPPASSLLAIRANHQGLLTPLHLHERSKQADEENVIVDRRGAITKVALTSAAVAVLSPDKALADGEGRTIVFTVENLDGEPGKTGTFTVKTRPDWAPIGAERFETLVSEGFFEGCRAFRVLPGFIVSGALSIQFAFTCLLAISTPPSLSLVSTVPLKFKQNGDRKISRTIPWPCPTRGAR